MKNDGDLLNFKDDVISVEKAENVVLDTLQGDLNELLKELDSVKDASKRAGEKQRGDDGKLVNPTIKKTLQELREQKTHVREICGVKFFNQMEHDVEYTPMEIFTHQAEEVAKGASEKIKETQQSFVAVLHYFGEDEKMSTSDFFGTLKKFFMAFEAAKDSVERLEVIRVCTYFLYKMSFFLNSFSKDWITFLETRGKTFSKGKRERSQERSERSSTKEWK